MSKAADDARPEAPDSDPFTIAKSEWLKMINADKRLSPLCFGVAYFGSDVSSVRTEGHSWQSVSTLAAGTGSSQGAVQNALARLAEHGYVDIESRRERRKPSRLWWSFASDGRTPRRWATSTNSDDVTSTVSVDATQRRRKRTSPVSDPDIPSFRGEHPQKLPTSLLTESADSSAVAPPSPEGPKQKATKKITITKEHETAARELLIWLQPEIGRSLVKRRWIRELAEFEAEGLMAEFVIGAFWTFAVERRLPETVTTLKYFEGKALELKAKADKQGDFWWWDQQGELQLKFCELKHAEHVRDPSLPSPYRPPESVH